MLTDNILLRASYYFGFNGSTSAYESLTPSALSSLGTEGFEVKTGLLIS